MEMPSATTRTLAEVNCQCKKSDLLLQMLLETERALLLCCVQCATWTLTMPELTRCVESSDIVPFATLTSPFCFINCRVLPHALMSTFNEATRYPSIHPPFLSAAPRTPTRAVLSTETANKISLQTSKP